jgi:hypothetical protein
MGGERWNVEDGSVMANDINKPEMTRFPVVLGMTPSEARHAGGAFFFKVTADPSKWGKNADPYQVMWAQSQQPDDSQIWMTFKNVVQYPSEGEQTFRVYFQRGKAVEIEKLSNPNRGEQI